MSMGFPKQEYWSGLPLPSAHSSSNIQFHKNTYKLCLEFIDNPHGHEDLTHCSLIFVHSILYIFITTLNLLMQMLLKKNKTEETILPINKNV